VKRPGCGVESLRLPGSACGAPLRRRQSRHRPSYIPIDRSGVRSGPGRDRTCDLGIKSPASQGCRKRLQIETACHEPESSTRRDAANATFGDRRVRARGCLYWQRLVMRDRSERQGCSPQWPSACATAVEGRRAGWDRLGIDVRQMCIVNDVRVKGVANCKGERDRHGTEQGVPGARARAGTSG
jgi:hypothetical protein